MLVEIAANSRPPERGSTRWCSGFEAAGPRDTGQRRDEDLEHTRRRATAEPGGSGGTVCGARLMRPVRSRGLGPGIGLALTKTERTPGHTLARVLVVASSRDLRGGHWFVTPTTTDSVRSHGHPANPGSGLRETGRPPGVGSGSRRGAAPQPATGNGRRCRPRMWRPAGGAPKSPRGSRRARRGVAVVTDRHTRILALVAHHSQRELERHDALAGVPSAAAAERRQALAENAKRTRTRLAMARIRRSQPSDG
jgi:hypothetical protein